MSVNKTRNGRWLARLKSGREFIASKTFDTRREANDWIARERAALAGGVDPRAGRRRVRDLLPEWLEVRRKTKAQKTYEADEDMTLQLPASMLAMQVGAVSEREVSRWLDAMVSSGLKEGSVTRYRASLSRFFSWCVREKRILVNPVSGVPVPKSSDEQVEMNPWTEDGLELAWQRWRAYDERIADILLVMGWVGPRWAEARSFIVADLMELPTPGILVRRSAPERVGTKATKGRKTRRTPLADRVLPMVRQLAEDKGPDDLLLTTSRGSRLHRTSILRAVHWDETSEGRRLHDLRHTAACLWLSRGVDPSTVQAWLGHESIGTTNKYVHFLGTAADQAGLARLNSPRGHAGGTSSARPNESQR